jgi:tetratricopeptide (TPR) repeat protein
MLRTRLTQLLAFVFLASTTYLAASRLPAARERPYDVQGVPRPEMLRLLSLGHPTLAANVFWLRAVQYIGEPNANTRGWDRLLPVAELVTDLDPSHAYAYQVTGTILGSVGRTAESNAILEKGMRNVPNRYILAYLRAFNAFYYDGDYARAGEFVERAARIPGAPAHLRQNVLAMYVKGKRADAAIAFLMEAHGAAQDDDTREVIEGQLRRAVLERNAVVLDDAIAAYRARFGFVPVALQLLVPERLLEFIPPDPNGGSWIIDEDGRVRSTVDDHRFAPPEKQAHANPEPKFDPGKQRSLDGMP